MQNYPVKVCRFDADRARSRPAVPFDVVFDGVLPLRSTSVDDARKEVQAVIGVTYSKRIRGCSVTDDGGFVVNIDP